MKKLSFGGFLKGMAKIIANRPALPKSLENNPTLEIILNRRSVRQFKKDPIPDDAFAAIIEAGRVAPSTVNSQTWSFVTFTDDEWKEFFGNAIPFNAKRVVIILADTYRMRQTITEFPYAPLCEYTIGVMNSSIAAMSMNIAAESLGISSVMLSDTGRSGFYDAKYLAEKMDLPPGVVPTMTIVFGYAKAASPPMPPKFPTEAITFSGKYKNTPKAVRDEWLNGMQAGYKAMYITSAFDKQIAYYKSKIEQSEIELKKMVFYAEENE